MKISLDTQQKARHVIEEQRLIIDKLQRIAFPKTYGEYTAGEAWSDLTNAIKT